MYSIEQLVSRLKELGIEETDLITVHTSLRAVGKTENGGEGVITALKTAVKRGLLLVPAHTWRDVFETKVYDVRNSQPCIGTLPKIAVDLANRASDAGDVTIRRSLHPSHSVVAFGDMALEYLKDDERVETAIPLASSYGKLMTERGKILLIGVGLNRNTFLHIVAEYLATEPLKKTPITVIDYDGSKTKRQMCSTYGDHELFPDYSECLDAAGAIKRGRFGDAEVVLCDAKKSFDAVLAFEKGKIN